MYSYDPTVQQTKSRNYTQSKGTAAVHENILHYAFLSFQTTFWYCVWPHAHCIIKNLIYDSNVKLLPFPSAGLNVSLYTNSSHPLHTRQEMKLPLSVYKSLLSGNSVRVLVKERLLTPNLTPGECSGLRKIGPYLLEAVGVCWELEIPQKQSN